ncbi:MAG: hypothetical protein EA411_06175 [Saprospirales bacterium]|nr:MAG: hypothetical protein EA411_06175 [Saprospirales bacterium]
MRSLNKFIGIFLALAFFGLSTELTAQTKITSGHLILQATDVKMPGMQGNPEMEMAMEMLKDGSMEIYFTEDKSLSVHDMAAGMSVTKTLMDSQNDRGVMYMNMMGQKMKIDMGSISEIEDYEEDYTIEIYEDDRKEILGFDAYRVVMKVEAQGQSMEMEFYITEQIKTMASLVAQIPENPFPGTALKMSMNMMGMELTFEAVEFNEKFDTSVFDIDDSQYREMDMDALQQMGGGGFGF